MKYYQASLDNIYKHVIGDEFQSFTPEAMHMIIEVIFKYYKEKRSTPPYPDLTAFHEFDWSPAKLNGRTFAQRITDFIKKKWDFNLPFEITTAIGNIAGLHRPVEGPVRFDFTNKFDWRSGDYGDGGSCFWAGRSNIRSAMEEHGDFYAIRFYEPRTDMMALMKGAPKACQEDNREVFLRGVGRSWLFETNVTVTIRKKEIITPIIIIFNSYGIGINQQSAVLASFFKKGRHPVYLTNNKREHGGLYVNGPGYAIGDPQLIRSIRNFDFGLENNYDDIESRLTNDDPAPLPIYHGGGRRKNHEGRYSARTQQERCRRKSMLKENIMRAQLNASDKSTHIDYTSVVLYSAQINRNTIASCLPLFSHKKQDKPMVALARKLGYNPLKVINYHIKYQLNKEIQHDQTRNSETTT